MFYWITLSALVASLVALVGVSVGALSLRRKLRSSNLFAEKSTVRTAYRDMMELLADAAGLGSHWSMIEQIVSVEEQILRVSRLKAQVAEHVLRDLCKRVRELSMLESLPEGWSRTVIRGLDGQLTQETVDWTLRALSAWRDEMQSTLRRAIAQQRASRMHAMA